MYVDEDKNKCAPPPSAGFVLKIFVRKRVYGFGKNNDDVRMIDSFFPHGGNVRYTRVPLYVCKRFSKYRVVHSSGDSIMSFGVPPLEVSTVYTRVFTYV